MKNKMSKNNKAGCGLEGVAAVFPNNSLLNEPLNNSSPVPLQRQLQRSYGDGITGASCRLGWRPGRKGPPGKNISLQTLQLPSPAYSLKETMAR